MLNHTLQLLKKGEYIAVSMSNWYARHLYSVMMLFIRFAACCTHGLLNIMYHNNSRPMPTLEVPRHICFPIKAASHKSNKSDIGTEETKENGPALASKKGGKSACSLNIKPQPLDLMPTVRKSGDVGCSIPLSAFKPESPALVNPNNERPNEAGHKDHQISCWIDAITVSVGSRCARVV